jgi:hypothetical protein
MYRPPSESVYRATTHERRQPHAKLLRAGEGLAALLILLFTARPSGAQRDILCRSSNARYAQPGECAARCRAAFESERCALQPQTAALNDSVFLTYYNAILFNNGNSLLTRGCLDREAELSLGAAEIQDAASGGKSAPPPAGYDENREMRSKLIQRIMMAWFGGEEISHYQYAWGRDEAKNVASAILPMQNGKYPVYISVNLLCKSPAFIVTSTGHALIHVEQYRRAYNGFNSEDLAIRKARDALREVEAREWETNTGAFPWKLHTANRWFSSLTSAERNDLLTLKQCAEWNAGHEIEALRGDSASAAAVQKLAQFMQQDPWVRANWLPHHADWATHRAGPQPDACKNPPFGAY